MSTVAVTTVLEARSNANVWLLGHLPDRFAAGVPEHEERAGVWRVSVWLSYPQLEPLGPVGELVLDETSGELRQHTPIDEMRARAAKLYRENSEQIEAPLL
jgi:predicted metallopeptidase